MIDPKATHRLDSVAGEPASFRTIRARYVQTQDKRGNESAIDFDNAETIVKASLTRLKNRSFVLKTRSTVKRCEHLNVLAEPMAPIRQQMCSNGTRCARAHHDHTIADKLLRTNCGHHEHERIIFINHVLPLNDSCKRQITNKSQSFLTSNITYYFQCFPQRMKLLFMT